MARSVTPPARGFWKLALRVQRYGLSASRSGKGAPWLALTVGVWGLRKVHDLSLRREEILLSEPLRPGDQIVITHQRTTRAEAKKAEAKARKAAERAAADAKAEAKSARRSARRRSRG